MKEIRDGHIDGTVDQLTAAKDRASSEERLALDERIAMLYLAAYRWTDAIAHAEANLLGTLPDPIAREEGDVTPPLRRALGVAPPVWVELLGAYGRTGDLDRAAQMLARLEDVCAGRDDAAVWIHRARLMFLALAGRPSAVQALVDPRRARHMSPAARTYWLAVAHEHKGDRAAATAAYEKARGRSRGRPRELIDQALAKLATADGMPVKLSDEATEVLARVEASPLPPEVRASPAPRPWATWSLTGGLLVAAAAITLLVGSTSDVGVLTRAGALVRGLVDGGEWWRVFSCVFVHVGGLHLIVNVLGMWFVGRISEELFGTSRTFAVFGVAGIAGAVASYLASPAGISAGASGALFGLLGAVFVELTLHRHRYRAAWKRGMWGGLAVVIVAQLGYGFLYPVIDQWAHGAGLGTGALLGAILSPHASWARAGRQLGRGLAIVSVGFILLGGARVVRTSVEESFSRLPRIRHQVGGVLIAAPATWSNDVELAEPDGLVILAVHRTPKIDQAAQMSVWIAETAPTIARNHGFERVVPATDQVIPLPGGWEGKELVAWFTDPMGYRQHYRLIVCGRVFGSDLVTVVIHTPESIARVMPRYLARMLASIKPALGGRS
jgi:membrane associated rhomboid family serine protease